MTDPLSWSDEETVVAIYAALDAVARLRARRRAEAHVAAGGDLLDLPLAERVELGRAELRRRLR